MAIENESERQKKNSRVMRVVSFAGGCVFVVLGGIDAMVDPFPGTETFLAGTGVALVIVGVTGRWPRGGGQS